MRGVAVPPGVGGVQAIDRPATVYGYSVRESADPAAVATVVLRDGTSSAAPPRVFIELTADESATGRLPGVDFYTGVYVDRVAGSTELVLYAG